MTKVFRCQTYNEIVYTVTVSHHSAHQLDHNRKRAFERLLISMSVLCQFPAVLIELNWIAAGVLNATVMVRLVAYLKNVTPIWTYGGYFTVFFSISTNSISSNTSILPPYKSRLIRMISLIILSKFVPSDSFFTDLHRPVGNKAQGTNFKKLVEP